MLKLFKDRLYLLLIPAVTLWTFWQLPNTFYQQDEWQTLGHIFSGESGEFANVSGLQLLFGELRPLSTAIYLVFIGIFKFNVVPATLFAIFLHLVNAFLVFYLTNKITRNKLISLMAALFLIVNSVSHQAVTWVSAMGTIPATTFILIALITYLKYLETEKRKYILMSLLSLILSLYFKGIGIFLFILFPLMFFIFKNKSINQKNLAGMFRANLWLFILGFVMISVRFGQFFIRSKEVAGYTSSGGNVLSSLFLHSVLYPLTSLLQIFIPSADFYPPMSDIARFQYKFLVGSPLVDLVAQSAVSDMVSLLGTILILLFFAIVFLKTKNKLIGKNILFALLFFFLSFVPYMLLDRDSSYLSGRYFYVGAVPAGILFGYVVYFLININKYVKWTVLLLVTLFLFHHASIVKSDINYQVNLGDQRKAVLTGIKNLYPNISRNSIFYVTSDKQYYGPITNPFQNGLGYVLEVWYYDSGNIPKDFLSENFLWDLGAEGYKKEGNYGFGYYQNIDKMVSDMKINKLKVSQIHAFFIRSSDTKILDITSEIRDRISTISALPR